ncbi:hypothetical protein ACFL08_02830 [Patescibacteria group bacterium]
MSLKWLLKEPGDKFKNGMVNDLNRSIQLSINWVTSGVIRAIAKSDLDQESLAEINLLIRNNGERVSTWGDEDKRSFLEIVAEELVLVCTETGNEYPSSYNYMDYCERTTEDIVSGILAEDIDSERFRLLAKMLHQKMADIDRITSQSDKIELKEIKSGV